MKQAEPGDVSVRQLSSEELFRSVLDEEQLSILDGEWPDYPGNSEFSWTHIPIDTPKWDGYGEWKIQFYFKKDDREGTLSARLFGPGRVRCFQVVDGVGHSLNREDAYLSALAMFCMLQANPRWVNGEAGF